MKEIGLCQFYDGPASIIIGPIPRDKYLAYLLTLKKRDGRSWFHATWNEIPRQPNCVVYTPEEYPGDRT